MKTILILGVFFTFLALTATSANAKKAALPSMTDHVCSGAVAIDKLIKVNVSKTDLDACPKGLRSPYLCAMHKAGMGHRSLGHAMRHTIADLGDGTCGRVNLQGTLVYKDAGATVEGNKFVDPRVKMPEVGLRFGAWKAHVLYLTPAAGEAELASCMGDLTVCGNKLAQIEKCRTDGKLYDPASNTCVSPVVSTASTAVRASECPKCAKCLKTATVAASECPMIECPVFDLTPLHAEIRTCATARDALQTQVNALTPVHSVIEQCRATHVPYDPESGQCINTTQLARFLGKAQVDRIDGLVAQVREMRTLITTAQACSAGGGKFNFTGDTTGWCSR